MKLDQNKADFLRIDQNRGDELKLEYIKVD